MGSGQFKELIWKPFRKSKHLNSFFLSYSDRFLSNYNEHDMDSDCF